MDKKKIIIPYVIATAMILGILGYTFAYFSATVKEEGKTETVIKTKSLNLIYTGVKEITTGDNMIPGDSFTKTFTVENTGEVKATFDIYMENITNEFNEDLVYTISDENGVIKEETPLPVTGTKSYISEGIEIEAGATKTYTLKIEYKYLDTPQNDYQGSTFRATVGIDGNKIENNVMTPDVVISQLQCKASQCLDNDGSGDISIGDLITYDTESFYVYSNDGSTIKMLAEYNLYVGGEYNTTTKSYTAYGSEATGLQDENMLAYTTDGIIRKGVTVFSNDNVSGTNFSDYDGSIVQDYVQTYAIKLTEKGINYQDVTLISKEELEKIGDFSITQQSQSIIDLVPTWLYKTTYWVKTSYSNTHVGTVSAAGRTGYDLYSSTNAYGVRPVIYISADEI